ncbi:MAG: hypothetical protein GTN80_05550 [Nitrososphaeria archaeon]|nr:hypothetical protein [Nitrososphaeria archaeon]NIN52613.1 hypothetical protein [Nitrososphaeria archaeon]NIQ33088.1 hypothetical protein [Nitrososphaeria archaeon]
MSATFHHPLMKYIRNWALPHTHCSGCGNGTIAACFLRAVDQLGLDQDKMVCVSGIGCSGWIPSPLFDMDVLHTTHGRSIAFATGVKLTNPNLKVSVFTGDGDGAAIGANHLVQAARRNIGLTVTLVNNRLYGMTGGQVAPTTPKGTITATTPFGSLERSFDLCELVRSAGASYVARWTTYHLRRLTASMKETLQKKGFSFIEVISHCPVQYGRRVGMENPIAMLRWLKDASVTLKKAEKMSEEELKEKIIIGKFIDVEIPELSESYTQLFRRLGYEAPGN